MSRNSGKNINEDCANSASGCGVRGLGNVTGTPKVGEEGEVNPHIERVGAEAKLNGQAVLDWIKNNTSGLYTFDSDDWWEDRKGQKTRTSKNGKSSKAKFFTEGMEKDHYKAIDDVHVNLDNRNHAIEDYGYGPMNPHLENEDFWKKKAKLWQNTPEEAMQSRCGNCAAFNQSKKILDRIAENLGPAGNKITEMAGLGFCEMFHFKCAAERTCDAWLVNGPITEQEGGAPANVSGSGNIAGLGVGPKGEPGISVPVQKKHKKRAVSSLLPVSDILRRPKPVMEEVDTGMFAGETTFIVPSHVYERMVTEKRKHKHWRTFINENDISPVIREYANANPDSPIFLEDKNTGYITCVRYGKRKKEKSSAFRR